MISTEKCIKLLYLNSDERKDLIAKSLAEITGWKEALKVSFMLNSIDLENFEFFATLAIFIDKWIAEALMQHFLLQLRFDKIYIFHYLFIGLQSTVCSVAMYIHCNVLHYKLTRFLYFYK